MSTPWMPIQPQNTWTYPNRTNSASSYAPPLSKSTDGALQRQFPGNYAHLASAPPWSNYTRQLAQTGGTLNKVRQHVPVKDHQLATFNDQAKMAGSLMIATLATLGLKQGVMGVGEFLGFASWFGAMAATPKVINGMVQWKTGVDLNQRYDSTYGQRLNLFNDPNYLPFHILPEATIDRAANKLGIPKGPNRRQATEEKMRQISVQSHTWWMLVAGPATPVISGLICDTLQDPLLRGVSHIKTRLAGLKAEQTLRQASDKSPLVVEHTQAYLDQLVGELPNSELANWWKSFGRGIIREAGLDRALPLNTMMSSSRDEQVQKLVEHLMKEPPSDRVFHYLNAQFHPESGKMPTGGALEDLHRQAGQFLEKAKAKMPEKTYKEQQRFLEARILNAKATVNHYWHLMRAARNAKAAIRAGQPKDVVESEIRSLLKDANINAVQRTLMQDGNFVRAEQLVGDVSIFERMSGALQRRQYKDAFNLMGASPEKHLLDDALKNLKLGNMWRRRMGLYLGGGLMLATAIYSAFFVGRDFKADRHNSDEGSLYL